MLSKFAILLTHTTLYVILQANTLLAMTEVHIYRHIYIQAIFKCSTDVMQSPYVDNRRNDPVTCTSGHVYFDYSTRECTLSVSKPFVVIGDFCRLLNYLLSEGYF